MSHEIKEKNNAVQDLEMPTEGFSTLTMSKSKEQIPCDHIMASSKACDDCRKKCGKGHVTQETLMKMEEAFDQLNTSTSQSLLKKYLNRFVFDTLKEIQTPLGANLLDCIQSGCENPDSGIGLYASDPDAYAVFNELFDPLIEDYHGFKRSAKHPKSNWGNPNDLKNLDPEGKYVVSTRVRCGRSLDTYPFNPLLTEAQYLEIEQKISTALKSMQGEAKGTYYPLKLMTPVEQQKLIDDHFLFKEGDRFLQSAQACRFWPDGRGIFYNPKKTFLAWINEEDHVRLISMQAGGDLREVYKRLMDVVAELDKLLVFARSDRLGYLTFCPTNLGTTIRASVHIKLPKLSADKEKLDKAAAKYNLQVRGTSGEHSAAKDNVYDISNKRRLGLTEFQALKEMSDGISALIKMETS
ncbi:PREDICTED: arginine kinase-like [Nicrophorus vespilloides]|uniref:arginine kinase n=1 Tax=Nicrophorus vespilloides TaxID=110193 RepID=A0ABM1MED4_NICVS|nr:PREDICTED: arginine kinase-like [Nicrophorus vespilloides]